MSDQPTPTPPEDTPQDVPADPFAEARAAEGVMHLTAKGCPFPVLLRHGDVRAALKDWKTFSNDDPFHITPEPETGVRDMRQLPIETDPPEHTAYRKLVDPFFRRPLDAAYRADMQAMIDAHVKAAVEAGEVEVVNDFALPVQSKALTRMLGVPESEAEIYMSWGQHVLYDDAAKERAGESFVDYTRRKIDESTDPDGKDFFSHLNHAEIGLGEEGGGGAPRKLTDAEKRGYVNLTFAGGRDTVIRTITAVFAHLAADPSALAHLRADEAHLAPAVEEYLRHASPLTTLARRCPHGADIAGQSIPEGGRIGINYAAANYDPAVFPDPERLDLTRRPNPHVAFGFGKHHCLGAHQARLILTCLLRSIISQINTFTMIRINPVVELDATYTRRVGYEHLVILLNS